MKRRHAAIPVLLALVCCATVPKLARAQIVRPHFGQVATVTDQAFIKEFLDQQSLPVAEAVDSLEFIDADGAGFGENDLVTVFPGRQTYALINVEGPTRSYMQQWKTASPHQYTGPRENSTKLFQEAAEPERRDPLVGMLAFVMRGVEQFYTGENVEGRFRRDSTTVYLELWNFDKAQLVYRDLKGSALSDTLQAFDLLQIQRNDTLLLTDTTMYDVIYVYKTFRDTIYIPESKRAAPER